MKLYFLLSFILLLSYTFGKKFGNEFIKPEQIHLSYGRDPTSMMVTWSTMNATDTSVALVDLATHAGNPSTPMMGSSSRFVAPGTGNHTQYIHTVTMRGLKPGTAYKYMVGSKTEGTWSKMFVFRTMKNGTDWSPSIGIYGDFGFSNHKSLDMLLDDHKKGTYDAIFHVGDFAYDMDTENGIVGDEFMNMIEPISAELPYMTCPGNHENAYNFTHYKRRFTMPRDENMENMFYSFDIGPVHVISLSTEFYFYIQYGFVQVLRQYYWLQMELQEANKPENRAKHPWIITIGHRPMYCSNTDKDDCTKHHSLVRDGIPIVNKFGLEEMFQKNGVDLAIWAHEHSYERLWPVYKDKVMNGSKTNAYRNPRAPVHITSGSAGCQEDHDPFIPDPRPWSAFRSDDYGYSRMKVFNSTHLYMEQVSENKNAVIDSFWIIKDKHGSYADM